MKKSTDHSNHDRFVDLGLIIAVLDGELRETQTTDYFSKHRRSDCAVRELTAR